MPEARIIEPSFRIQHATADQYQLGTMARRLFLPLETLLSGKEGIIALLEYGEITRAFPGLWKLLWLGEDWSLQQAIIISFEGDRAILTYEFNTIKVPEEALRNSYAGSMLLDPRNGCRAVMAKALYAGIRKNLGRIVGHMAWMIRQWL
ncbi:uncharacterized protein BDW43DRAFT_255993 [Aspergillus alliaceus]|uniref:uncharacterized protein n=1 Tax=Petromyces alliaceus TaxID=209559 RepID=UPI0012A6FE0C|nr:uncharacterized protein BDW43DRAFT_255993 [Aspergillus alliaceus]KAB8227261.1 hypothetical protein BDW43DRAFT_255993 [Aspergillus alliaceus]